MSENHETSSYKEKAITEAENVNLSCGYRSWRPRCIQKFNNSKCLLAAVCFFTFVQGWVVNGINNINTSTLERRFDLRSSQIAWTSSGYDISAGIMGIILGYVSGFKHKGTMMSVGAAIMAVGSFVMFLPHLLVGNYDFQPSGRDDCDRYGNYTDPNCGTGASSSSNYLYVFIAGQVLHGVGGASAYTIGLTYLDDNVGSKDLSLYVGFMHCFAALGPAIAYIAGGALLNIYVDVGRVNMDEIKLTPSDPGWVGAWWIGFIISCFVSAIVSLVLACFPRELPGSRLIKAERVSDAYNGAGEDQAKRDDFGRSWSDLGLSLKVVFANPTWVFLTVGALFESAGVSAFATFLPKIMEFQFRLTPGMASIFTGVIVVPGAAGGQLLGGVVPRLLGSRLRGLLVQMSVYSAIALALGASFLIRCEMPKIGGVNVPYFNASTELDREEILQPCNAKCSCTTRSYEPLCGHDDILYFSPCHAGCDNKTLSNGNAMYAECSCITALNHSAADVDPWMAQDGVCDASCNWQLGVFIVLFLIVMLVTFMSNTLGHTAAIKCVPDRQRGFSYGLQGALVRFIGNVPAPIAIGQVFDSSCLLWQEQCGQTGACWIYDSNQMALRLTLSVFVIKGITCLSYSLACILYKPPKDQDNVKQTESESDQGISSGISNGEIKLAKYDQGKNGFSNIAYDENDDDNSV